jgi:hypothetical protein
MALGAAANAFSLAFMSVSFRVEATPAR